MNRWIYIAFGFVFGLMLMDLIYLRDEVSYRYYDYELGMLIMAYHERPEKCPICRHKFHYFFEFRDGELQGLINDYL